MSSASHASELGDAGSRSATRTTRRQPSALTLRTLFGALLALIAVAATLAGGYVFAGLVAIGSVVAVREWHRMVGTAQFAREVVVAGLAIVAALAITMRSTDVITPLCILAGGALVSAGLGALKHSRPILSGFGTLYVGIPAYSIVALRMHTADAQWIVLGVFITIWAADTGALFVGQFLGGPKLLPGLSPNKTWTGLLGGLILPATIAAVYVSIFGGNVWLGLAVGFVLAAVGHAGDLFESWIKRRAGRKDSGGIIPGHGGVLDRIDSMLFAAPLAAALFHYQGAAQLFGIAS